MACIKSECLVRWIMCYGCDGTSLEDSQSTMCEQLNIQLPLQTVALWDLRNLSLKLHSFAMHKDEIFQVSKTCMCSVWWWAPQLPFSTRLADSCLVGPAQSQAETPLVWVAQRWSIPGEVDGSCGVEGQRGWADWSSPILGECYWNVVCSAVCCYVALLLFVTWNWFWLRASPVFYLSWNCKERINKSVTNLDGIREYIKVFGNKNKSINT